MYDDKRDVYKDHIEINDSEKSALKNGLLKFIKDACVRLRKEEQQENSQEDKED
jgi:hypothetical protein